MRKILVLDAEQRSALACTRSLGKLVNTEVFCADTTTSSLAGSSKYCSGYFQYPSPYDNTMRFLAWMRRILDEHRFDVVLPVTEVTSRLLIANQESMPSLNLPFASYDTIMKASDKVELTKTAHKLDIPVPFTQYYRNASEIDKADVFYPCVIKPALSKINVCESWLSTQVHVVESESQLKKLLENEEYLISFPFMIQEFISGQGAGLFCLYDRGVLKATFAHRRLREKPPSGGVSVLSESTVPDKLQLRYATTLLDNIGWHGVAMVEFRVDDNGTPYLMEINARFWGSLQLAIDSNINFPSWLIDIESGFKIPQLPKSKEGQQLRWLMGDIDHLYLVLRSSNYSLGAKLSCIWKFLKPHYGRRRYEINRWEDLKPAWYELRKYFGL